MGSVRKKTMNSLLPALSLLTQRNIIDTSESAVLLRKYREEGPSSVLNYLYEMDPGDNASIIYSVCDRIEGELMMN